MALVRRPTVRIALAAALAVVAAGLAQAADEAAASAPAAERALATFALTGMRLSAQESTSPKLTPELRECLLGLRPEVLVPTYRRMLELALEPDEIAATEAIYGGPLGPRLLVAGVAAAYRQRGLVPPDGDATFTPDDERAHAAFVATSAGTKLLQRNVLDAGAPRHLLDARFDELFAACRDARLPATH